MNRNLKIGLLSLFAPVLVFLTIMSTTISANAAGKPPILLVYDSKNIAEHAELQLDRCQRILTSMGLRVRTTQLSHYEKNELKTGGYQAVVTMKNWQQLKQHNSNFEHDRAAFKGVKLHIGPSLQADEKAGLRAQFKTITHQQLSLHQGRSSQLLSENQRLIVASKRPTEGLPVGWLSSQSRSEATYPYGLKVGKSGFLPAIGQDGLSQALAAQLMSELFNQPARKHKPLLTITGVTPYTDLKDLHQLISQLTSRGHPFALSINSEVHNSNLSAFHRYTRELRFTEKSGGLIFLSPSIETGAHHLGLSELRSAFQTELSSLGADHVYPIGLSASGYWNQSEKRQRAVLHDASHVLMTPNQPAQLGVQPVEAEPKISESKQFKTGIVGVPLESFETVAHKEKLTFSTPTSLLVKMPANQAGIAALLRQLQATQINWFDPIADQLKTSLETGSALYGYRAGQYWLNGEPVESLDLDTNAATVKPTSGPEQMSWMNRVIQWQSHFLLWLFSAIGLLLVSLLAIGWRLYRGKFIRQHLNKDR